MAHDPIEMKITYITGVYSNMEKEAREKTRVKGMSAIEDTIKDMLNERKTDDQVINIFKSLDTDRSGCLEFDEFAKGYHLLNDSKNESIYLQKAKDIKE